MKKSFEWGGIRVLVQNEARAKLSEIVSGKALLVTGKGALKSQGWVDDVLTRLPQASQVYQGVPSNPELSDARSLLAKLNEIRPKYLVALGGGSVLDVAKVAKVAYQTGHSIEDLLAQKVSVAKKVPECGSENLFLVCLPSTSGTGSEVTSFATIWDAAAKKKYSLDTPLAKPQWALVDPQLASQLPLSLTRQTAGDALTHAVESIWSRRSSPLTDAVAVRAIRLIRTGLRACENPDRVREARSDLAWGALLAGMAISVTRTAAAHALSYRLTMQFGVPHGTAVATLLPEVMRVNLRALDSRRQSLLQEAFEATDSESLLASTIDFVDRHKLRERFQSYGVSASDLEALVQAGNHPGRLDNNCVALTETDLQEILERSL